MRILLLADVHANWEALIALQRAEPKPDAALFAGDAVGFGPDPANCARWLLANAMAVRGECDEALGGRYLFDSSPLAETARETVDFARRQLSPTDRAALSGWPLTASIELGGAAFVMAHGTPARPLDGELDLLTASEAQLAAALDGRRADVVLLGHTHVPALRRAGDALFVNPGSLGQPRYGLPDATYAVWQDGDVQIRHLHYDHEATARKLSLLPIGPGSVALLQQVLDEGMIHWRSF